MDIKKYIEAFEADLEEMSLNPVFNFRKMPHMPPKLQEMFDEIHFDIICPFFFAVIRHAKYPEDGKGAFRASIDLQVKAYKNDDFNYSKLNDSWGGSAKYFNTFEEAEQYLTDCIPKYFQLDYIGGKLTTEKYTLTPKDIWKA